MCDNETNKKKIPTLIDLPPTDKPWSAKYCHGVFKSPPWHPSWEAQKHISWADKGTAIVPVQNEKKYIIINSGVIECVIKRY